MNTIGESENHIKKPRILVADKDIIIRNMMSMALSDMSTVMDVSSAEEGLNRLAAIDSCNIVITSYSLPAMNGLDFLRLVNDRYPETTRILMTGGCSDLVNLNLAMTQGVINRIVIKPFSIYEFKEYLKNDLALK